jgi:hypothetical protein
VLEVPLGDVGGPVGGLKIRKQLEILIRQATTNQRLMDDSDVNILTLQHEALVADPYAMLERICTFLELEAPEPWLQACSSIIFKNPKKTRHLFDYPPELKQANTERMHLFPFLANYCFDD